MCRVNQVTNVLRILVIDRNPERAAIVERALKETGEYLVEVSPGASHLLELLRVMQPDVLIVDLDLPDRDTIEQLRVATSEMPRPIVMFVDRSDTETMRAAVSAGVSAYVVDGLQARRVKPIIDVAVARFQEFENLRRELELAKTSLAERKLIDRAKGILMRVRGLSEDEAYALLRRKAMHDQKKVVEIAQSVITAAELLK
jgi:response regulator NasT